MAVVVLAPAAMPAPSLPAGVRVVAWHEASAIAHAIRNHAGATLVIWSDGLGIEDQETLAGVVRASGARCIEVRSERWDGVTPSPLSAACLGVISGFGSAGVAAGVGWALETEA